MKRGILFMTTDKSLISFSLISSMWEKCKKDSIDMLIPFVLYSFSQLTEENSIVSIKDTKTCIEQEFGIKILSNIIEIIFKRLCKSPHDFLIRDGKQYILSNKRIDLSDFKNQRETNKLSNLIVKENFCQFLDNKGMQYDKTEAEKALITYLCNYGKEVITDNIVPLEKGDLWNYRVGEFVQSVLNENEIVADYIKNIAKGGMISNIMFNTSIDNYSTKKRFNNTTIYYDTTLLMYLLGYSGVALEESVMELTELLKKQNAQICCFRHNVDELEGILNAYIRLYNSGKLSEAYNFDYFIENEITPAKILEYIALLEKNLKKHGVIVKDTPHYQNVQNNIDWEKFEKYLEQNIKYNKADRRINDVQSLAAIYRLRKYPYYKFYENCQALFVTTNAHLVYHTKKYFRQDEEKTGIPAIVDDTFLTAFIWLKGENINGQLPTLKIVADALSSQSLPNDFWDTFLKKVEEHEEQNIITSDEATRLKMDIFTKKNAYDLTNGEIDKIDHGTMKEILKRNERERQRDILNENEALKQSNVKKDNEISDISKKFVLSRFEFYNKPIFSKWKTLLTIGKHWLWFACVIIVAVATIIDIIINSNFIIAFGSAGFVLILEIINKFFDKKLSSCATKIQKFFYQKSFLSLTRLIKINEKEYVEEILNVFRENIKEFDFT